MSLRLVLLGIAIAAAGARAGSGFLVLCGIGLALLAAPAALIGAQGPSAIAGWGFGGFVVVCTGVAALMLWDPGGLHVDLGSALGVGAKVGLLLGLPAGLLAGALITSGAGRAPRRADPEGPTRKVDPPPARDSLLLVLTAIGVWSSIVILPAVLLQKRPVRELPARPPAPRAPVPQPSGGPSQTPGALSPNSATAEKVK